MKNSNILTSAIVVFLLQIVSMVNAQGGGVNFSIGQVFQDESYSYFEGEVGIKKTATTFYVHYGQGKMIFEKKSTYDVIVASERVRDNRVVALGVRFFMGKNKYEYKGFNLDFQGSVISDKERITNEKGRMETIHRTNLRSTIGVGYRFKKERIFFDISGIGGYVNIVKSNMEGFSELKTLQLDLGLNAKVGFSF